MLDKESVEFLKELNKIHIHGKNILAKHDKKDIQPFFDVYKIFFNEIVNKELALASNVAALNKYKKEVSDLNRGNNSSRRKFTSQSKLESTIMEEFLCVILKNKFGNDVLQYGNIKAYSSLYFSYNNKESFKEKLEIRVNKKDQDVSIFKEVLVNIGNKEEKLYVPIVCIECKTYLDKTMLEGSVATASKIKNGNPSCIFFIVTETYDVAYDVSLSSEIDNIYILRKCKRKSPNTPPIQLDVIEKIIESIKNKLLAKDIDIIELIEKKGYLK